MVSTQAQTSYYISSSKGNNSNDGLTPNTAWKTISKINSIKFLPGNIIKFKSGDIFNDAPLTFNASGSQSKPIIIESYETGKKPVLGDSTLTYSAAVTITGSNVILDGLIILGSNKNTGSVWGIMTSGNNVTIKNCSVIGNESTCKTNSIGINVVAYAQNTVITSCDVSYWRYGIENYLSKPTEISYNKVHDIYCTYDNGSDGIRVIGYNDGEWHAFDYEYQVNIHHNEITKWQEQAIDLAYASNVIVEHNEMHNPLLIGDGSFEGTAGTHPDMTGSLGDAIKCGDWLSGDAASGGSKGNIFRYNTIHDLWRIQAINGGWGSKAFNTETIADVKIYYNLVYNVYGGAVKVAHHPNNIGSLEDSIIIFNNTFITGSSAIQIWGSPSNVFILNNICQSGVKVAGHHYNYPHPRNILEQQQIWHGTDPFYEKNVYDIRYYPIATGKSCYVDANILVNNTSVFAITHGGKGLVIDGKKANKYSTNPLFANVSNNDYSLQNGSPALNSGIGISTLVQGEFKDILGNLVNRMNPHIGAIQNSSTSNVTPTGLSKLLIVKATASDTEDVNLDPSKTIDGLYFNNGGNPSSRWAVMPCPQWLIYDLGMIKQINKTRISFYQYQSGRIYKYSLSISNDKLNWVKVLENVQSSTQEWTENIFNQVGARYLKVDILSNNQNSYANVWETEIWGSISSENTILMTKAFLEGPFNNNEMYTTLNNTLTIPSNQPFNSAPWNYQGKETVNTIPSGVVDWVLVELRSNTTSNSIVGQRAAFIMNNGLILDLDAMNPVDFPLVPPGDYYIVIKHRNHLPIMSKRKVSLSASFNFYDFTDSLDKAYGNEPMVLLANLKYGLYAGDTDANGIVNIIDYSTVGNTLYQIGYQPGDNDLNGIVNVLDYSKTSKNLLKFSNVP
jgi:hypothetical protein